MKIHISTIRAIIKNFQSTENVTKLPGRGRVSKDHSWRIAENSWVSGSENLKIVKQHLHHLMLFWEGFKKNDPSSSKNKWSQMKLKTSFLQQTLKMCLVNTGIKSTPCVQLNILLYFWCCGPIFLLEVLDILFRHTNNHGFDQIPTYKKQ